MSQTKSKLGELAKARANGMDFLFFVALYYPLWHILHPQCTIQMPKEPFVRNLYICIV